MKSLFYILYKIAVNRYGIYYGHTSFCRSVTIYCNHSQFLSVMHCLTLTFLYGDYNLKLENRSQQIFAIPTIRECGTRFLKANEICSLIALLVLYYCFCINCFICHFTHANYYKDTCKTENTRKFY